MGLSPLMMQRAERVRSPRSHGTVYRLHRKLERFKCWYKTRLHAGDGQDCGEFFRVKALPVSERHNGSEGCDEDGKAVSPAFWYRCGWQPMDQIPEGWRDVNAKAMAKKRELEAERNDTPQAKALRDLLANQNASSAKIAEAVGQLVQERTAGVAAKTPEPKR